MQNSGIEWTDMSWNPSTGCNMVSPACFKCYAAVIAHRLWGERKFTDVQIHPDRVSAPYMITKPQMVFVNSMSDLFHHRISEEFKGKVFKTMNDCSWHIFQVLTKRSKELLQNHYLYDWTLNIWMGVSVETEDYLFRIDDLRKTNAQIKFLSLEPLLGSLPNLDLTDIDWVIVGGESGPKARPMDPDWVREIRDLCIKQNVPFHFKQWGGKNKKKTGRILDGRTWDEYPEKNIILLEDKITALINKNFQLLNSEETDSRYALMPVEEVRKIVKSINPFISDSTISRLLKLKGIERKNKTLDGNSSSYYRIPRELF